VQQSWTSAA